MAVAVGAGVVLSASFNPSEIFLFLVLGKATVLRAHHLRIRVVIWIECHGNASLPLHSSLDFEYSIIEWELQGLERKMKTV